VERRRPGSQRTRGRWLARTGIPRSCGQHGSNVPVSHSRRNAPPPCRSQRKRQASAETEGALPIGRISAGLISAPPPSSTTAAPAHPGPPGRVRPACSSGWRGTSASCPARAAPATPKHLRAAVARDSVLLTQRAARNAQRRIHTCQVAAAIRQHRVQRSPGTAAGKNGPEGGQSAAVCERLPSCRAP
jgi:hypothetical protein